MKTGKNEQRTGAENVEWNLSALYSGVEDPAIDADMREVETLADAFVTNYREKVSALSAPALQQLLRDGEVIQDKAGRLSSFARLVYSTDTADPRIGALRQKVTEYVARIQQKTVFFELEWNKLEEDHVESLLDDPALADYRHYLQALRRYQPYQLSEIEEQLLLEKSVTGRQAWARLFMQLTGTMRYQFDGEELNQSQILAKTYDPDRSVRLKAADSVTAALREKAMELTFIFNVLAADKATDDRLRGLPTWVSSRNLSNKTPDEVVEALIAAVTSRYDLVARHYRLKRVILDLDELTDIDRYASIPVEGADRFYTWDEARGIVENAFAAFSPRLAETARLFFDRNWIHAKLAPNKRGGAYTAPVTPSANPYVFMNFTGKARDVATLAHELGHAIHACFINEHNNIYHAAIPLTTAEVASTFGEMLVFSDLIAKESDPAVRLAMLFAKIEDSFATVFRQTAMNRFEHGLHTARREEGELTTERIGQIWLETQRAMFGDSVTMRDDYGIWWSYVSHFVVTPGYVYAYSFGELLALALYTLYQEEGESFGPRYLDVLAAGDSDYPDQIMAQVGVDLNDPAFWHKGLAVLQNLIDQEETLAKAVFPDRF